MVCYSPCLLGVFSPDGLAMANLWEFGCHTFWDKVSWWRRVSNSWSCLTQNQSKMLGHTMIIHLGPHLQLLDGLQRNPGLQKKFNSWIFIVTYSNPMDWTKNHILAGWHQERQLGVIFWTWVSFVWTWVSTCCQFGRHEYQILNMHGDINMKWMDISSGCKQDWPAV